MTRISDVWHRLLVRLGRRVNLVPAPPDDWKRVVESTVGGYVSEPETDIVKARRLASVLQKKWPVQRLTRKIAPEQNPLVHPCS